MRVFVGGKCEFVMCICLRVQGRGGFDLSLLLSVVQVFSTNRQETGLEEVFSEVDGDAGSLQAGSGLVQVCCIKH